MFLINARYGTYDATGRIKFVADALAKLNLLAYKTAPQS